MAFRGDLGTFFSMATPIFGALEHWTGLKAFLDRSLGFNRLAFHHLDATLWHKLVVFPVPFVCFFSRFLSFFSIFGFSLFSEENSVVKFIIYYINIAKLHIERAYQGGKLFNKMEVFLACRNRW